MDDQSASSLNKAQIQEATSEAILPTMNSQSNIDNEQLPKHQFQPTKVESIDKTITIVQNQVPIDMTDGLWHDIPIIKYQLNVSGTISTAEVIWNIPMNIFLGLLGQYDVTTEAGSNNIMRSSDRELQSYIYFKLKQISQKFKNFNIFVERDESGGLQIQDELIFQVRKVYFTRWGQSTTIADTTSFSLSDLSTGIGSNFIFDTKGWITGDQFISTGSSYQPLSTIITTTQENFRIFPETVSYKWQMRLANFGTFTNVVVWMSYISEITANWEAMSKSIATNNILPNPYSTTSMFILKENDENVTKKRKLIE